MAGEGKLGWATCQDEGCTGVRLAEAPLCWEHAGDAELASALNRFSIDGHFDGRGVTFHEDLLDRVLGAAPRDENDRRILSDVNLWQATILSGIDLSDTAVDGDVLFDGATITGEVSFDGATITGEVLFNAATVNGAMGFQRAAMVGDVRFDEANITGEVRFNSATINGATGFEGATVVGGVTFDQATINGATGFEGATILGHVKFDEATITGDVTFYDVTVHGDVSFGKATINGKLMFGGTQIQGEAGFAGATIYRDATFNGATVHGATSFVGATFYQDAELGGIQIQGEARFTGATMYRDVTFKEATIDGAVWFDRATITGNATFKGVTVQSDAMFSGAHIQGEVTFAGARLRGDATFDRAAINGDANFSSAIVGGDARFTGVTFEKARQLGPVAVGGALGLNNTLFHQQVQVEVSAAAVSCRRARFSSGVNLRVRWADVDLEDAGLAVPSILDSAPRLLGDMTSDEWLHAWGDGPAIDGASSRPRLLSVRRADVAALTLARVDLRPCRFAGAHHLDGLQIDDGARLATAPKAWWRTSRQTIAEEHIWRTRQPSEGQSRRRLDGRTRSDWYGSFLHELLDPNAAAPPAGVVAETYRELRKGLEDRKDEPGAADFYYGEMEMRRRATSWRTLREHRPVDLAGGGVLTSKNPGTHRSAASAAGENAILTLYWLVSGYGLRAWRALASLAAVMLAAAVAFALWGFASPGVQPVDATNDGTPIYAQVERPHGLDELPTGLRVSAQAASSLLRGPDAVLTPLGEALHLGLRLTGPALLGLAVLSIRGRVKR